MELLKLCSQLRLLMSQGCSILVLMVKSYQEEICRRQANPSPRLAQAKARLPRGGREGARGERHLL